MDMLAALAAHNHFVTTDKQLGIVTGSPIFRSQVYVPPPLMKQKKFTYRRRVAYDCTAVINFPYLLEM